MKVSRAGTLLYDTDITNLKRARTFAGSSSTDHLVHHKIGTSKSEQRKVDADYNSSFDENLDIEWRNFTKKKSDSIFPQTALRQSGLYPRYESHEYNHGTFNVPATLDPRSDIEINPYSAVTFKIEDNLKTITEPLSAPSINKSQIHDPYTKVDFDVQPIKLLPYDAKLDLTPLQEEFMFKAAPFFETLEFSPSNTDETGILLKILNYEFEECSRREEEEEFRVNNKGDVIPWYQRIADAFISFINDLIKSWQPMSKEEYNEKYPWDKFYDPELYYDYKMDELHELNFDMIATDDVGTISKTNSFYQKKSHNYLSRRR